MIKPPAIKPLNKAVPPNGAKVPAAKVDFNPTGKTFDQCLQAFLADVKTTYTLTIGKDSGGD